jgi:Cu+-exporting ATPase
VFDKTGTITTQQEAHITFEGEEPSLYQKQLIRSLATQSGHPLSRAIVSYLPFQKTLLVKDFEEQGGRGGKALINGDLVQMGSAEFVKGVFKREETDGSTVYVSVNKKLIGRFQIKNAYREGIKKVLDAFKKQYTLSLISGDNDGEEQYLRQMFGKDAALYFNKRPHDKLMYIKRLQNTGYRVIMVGDGLNDAGALQQSDVGIAISDNINNFSPGSDIIFDGAAFDKLPALLNYCRKEKQIIAGSFVLSILYNVVGLSFAVQGTLSPVIAAILMPVSSISIVVYTTLMSKWHGRKLD